MARILERGEADALTEAERNCRCGASFTPKPDAGGRNRYRCPPCNAQAAQRYRLLNGETVRRSETLRARNPERALKVGAWSRRSKLLSIYGITPEQYDAMLASQDGVCATCGRPETAAATTPNPRLSARTIRRLAVDHDHLTERVRGLLCAACNTAIGLLQDNPELIRRVAAYIEVSRG